VRHTNTTKDDGYIAAGDQCEFYPRPDDGCVCAAGSDISGAFLCTREYSDKCQWADIARKATRDGD